MDRTVAQITVAGHLCLDVIPGIPSTAGSLQDLLVPGKLVDVGPAVTATGGAVSNAGLALHRLGIPTRLMGKVGDDLFGKAIVDLLKQHGPDLAEGMIIAQGEQSSYSIVISPPDVDRIFLHCTGTNDTFAADDVNMEDLSATQLFHFGYPPLMKRMYEDEGVELAALLAKVKASGVTVTLDMAKPDPSSPAGQVNWEKLLQRVLPYVDFFFPSFEEILFMLDRHEYDRMVALHPNEDMIGYATSELLAKLSARLLAMGAATVMIKLGEHGVYVRTTEDGNRWLRVGKCAPYNPEPWIGRELIASVFQVEVVGTTGAGDCTIAGFLAGIVKGLSLESIITAAVAVGACNVEQADATSGILRWEQVQDRIACGWEKRTMRLKLEDWIHDEKTGLWNGPNDSGRA